MSRTPTRPYNAAVVYVQARNNNSNNNNSGGGGCDALLNSRQYKAAEPAVSCPAPMLPSASQAGCGWRSHATMHMRTTSVQSSYNESGNAANRAPQQQQLLQPPPSWPTPTSQPHYSYNNNNNNNDYYYNSGNNSNSNIYTAPFAGHRTSDNTTAPALPVTSSSSSRTSFVSNAPTASSSNSICVQPPLHGQQPAASGVGVPARGGRAYVHNPYAMPPIATLQQQQQRTAPVPRASTDSYAATQEAYAACDIAYNSNAGNSAYVQDTYASPAVRGRGGATVSNGEWGNEVSSLYDNAYRDDAFAAPHTPATAEQYMAHAPPRNACGAAATPAMTRQAAVASGYHNNNSNSGSYSDGYGDVSNAVQRQQQQQQQQQRSYAFAYNEVPPQAMQQQQQQQQPGYSYKSSNDTGFGSVRVRQHVILPLRCALTNTSTGTVKHDGNNGSGSGSGSATEVVRGVFDVDLAANNLTEQFSAVMGNIAAVACTPRGKYLLVSVLRLQHLDKIELIYDEVLPQLNTLTLDAQGCHVVRTLIEYVTTERVSAMVSHLHPHTILLMATTSQHTRRVLQVIFEHHSGELLNPLVDVLASDCRRLCMTQQGCIAIMTVIERALPRQKQTVVTTLLPVLTQLMTDPYGNYVVQCILEHMHGCTTIAVLCAAFHGQWVALSCNKYASNVMEKAVWLLDGLTREQVLQELVFDKGNLQSLMQDGFGNFVLQAVIDSCRELGDFQRVYAVVAPQLHVSPYGHKIESKLKARYLALCSTT